MIELFEPTQLQHGIQRVAGMKITCKCGRVERTNLGQMRGFSDDINERRDQIVTRKFENMGWRVGTTPGKHRCPPCIKAETPAKLADVIRRPLAKLKEAPVTEPATAIAAPAAREPTREERRIIFAKLEETYADEKTGYHAPWTDKTVAEDLGVPRAWVSTMREENFGPAGSNPAIESLIAEAKAHLNAAQEMRSSLTETIRLSSARTDELNRAIEKAVRP